MKKLFTFFAALSCTVSFSQPIPELLYYNFDGTGTSVPNLASAPPAGTATATIMGSITQGPTGQCGNALIGSGISASTDYLNTGYATNLPGSWTISIWTSNITPSATLFYIFGDVTAGSFRCFTNGVAGANNWILRGGGITDVLLTGGATVASHVSTFVYDQSAGNIMAYLDGVLINTVAQGTPTITGTGPFKVMGYSTNVGAPAGGLLDEFRMYDHALSAAEVMQLVNLVGATITSEPKDSTLCAGNNASFGVVATNATGYQWQENNGSGFVNLANGGVYSNVTTATMYITGATVSMDTYQYRCIVGGTCSPSDTSLAKIITVNPLPTVIANATSTTVCAGTSVTLTGSGATSYVWTGGVTDGVGFIPSGTLTYTVTGTDANSCTDTAAITVNVNNLPTVIANATATTVCAGTSVTLSGSGAASYAWTGGVTDGVGFVPSGTLTYTVTGTDANSCTDTAAITVTINPLPTVIANANDTTVCAGTSVTLTGSGASSYVWTGGVTDGIGFVPTSTNTYTVTGTDGNSCTNTATTTVTVNNLPTVIANATATTVCAGTSVTLSGSGAASYVWTGGVTDGIGFVPSGTLTYTVTGTDANSCTDTAAITVNVNPLPTVALQPFSPDTVCITVSAFTLTGGSPASGTYSGNGVSAGMFNPSIAGAGTHTVTYTYTDGNGCADSASQTIFVDVCTGISQSSSLTAQISVYPNPNLGTFTIQSSEKISQIEITNVLGEKVYSFSPSGGGSVGGLAVNLSGKPDGIYFICIISDKGTATKKIIISK